MNRKILQDKINNYDFQTPYKMLCAEDYMFCFEHLAVDFPKVNSLTMYAFLMYAISQRETSIKHLAICNYLYFMEPYVVGADALIKWHLDRAQDIDMNNEQVLGWILSVYSGNPDSPFAESQLDSFRKTLESN